jgi:hypothetical protein
MTQPVMKQKQTDRMGSEIKLPLNAKIADLSTASSTFVVSPIKGAITKIYSAIQNAISSADADLTFEIGGVEITDSAITVAYTSSAAGDIDSSSPTALNIVAEGQAIEIITDGASSTACETEITIVIEPSR